MCHLITLITKTTYLKVENLEGEGRRIFLYFLLLVLHLPKLPKSQNANNGSYSQHFIFFVTCEWVQQARVLQYTRLERLARDKHSSLLGPFVSYEENGVL